MTGPAIAEPFRRRIRTVWGEDGARWLDALPALLRACEERWQLTLDAPFPLSYNYVAPARRVDGGELVLKAGVPREDIRHEIAALRHYGGSGAVRLLEADVAAGVMLIERIRPGTMLADLDDDAEATQIAARVMQALWRPPPAAHEFPAIADWGQRFRGPRPGPMPAPLFEAARGRFEELSATAAPPVVLHGDLHHGNLLRDEARGWLAIDPKGVIGEPAYEVGPLLFNPLPRIAAEPELDRILARRIEVLSAQLGFERERIAGWGIAAAVLSALWTLDDHEFDSLPTLAVAEALLRIGG